MKTFVGFGFGAIQGGLLLYEAFRSGRFRRFVVAEVVPETVAAMRKNRGSYWVNVAGADGIDAHEIPGVELFNPAVAADREQLVQAVAEADEIATALPSVKFFGQGESGSVTGVLAAGILRRLAAGHPRRSIVYTAENHNHAAEILAGTLDRLLNDRAQAARAQVQCLNTVIGKMSGVVNDPVQIAEQRLRPIAGDGARAFLVEAFNRIFITKIQWPDFERGIPVFEEKPDLLPFEEAKLYGHNATHALIGYLARLKGYAFMADMVRDPALIQLAREAFIEESGRALCRKHRGVDALFSETGYRAYAEDLLERMMNPHLRDAVDRVVRDPRRKLGWDDRLIGTMRVALAQGITPERYAQGASAALRMLQAESPGSAEELLSGIWSESKPDPDERRRILELIQADKSRLVLHS